MARVLVSDSDRLDSAPHPVTVSVLVVCVSGSTIVMRAIDFDDDGPSVADDCEVRAPEADVSDLHCRQCCAA
ncbi:hypothetical protein KCMC57_up56240 [Kitasatospora sp. CMC57]|uniref:Uncharacterized protein n=1 Tax=Kitasatospora sp. CMC57 TaxID=3231513 RepID=A0AB33K202_9ACTN